MNYESFNISTSLRVSDELVAVATETQRARRKEGPNVRFVFQESYMYYSNSDLFQFHWLIFLRVQMIPHMKEKSDNDSMECMGGCVLRVSMIEYRKELYRIQFWCAIDT